MTDTSSAARFRACVERGDLDAAADLFAEDAVFNSPVAHRPYVGREPLRAVLHAAFAVFEDFRYVDEYAAADGGHVLRFRAEVNGLAVEGVDILAGGSSGAASDGTEPITGLISELTVLVRPYSAATALRDRMAALLSG